MTCTRFLLPTLIFFAVGETSCHNVGSHGADSKDTCKDDKDMIGLLQNKVRVTSSLVDWDESPEQQHEDEAPIATLTKEYAISLDEIDNIKASFTSGIAVSPSLDELSRSSVAHECFNAQAWLEKFSKETSWKKYTQGDQDAVLSSLFAAEHLGTTDKNFVEFGFPEHDLSTSFANGRNLKENLGFYNYLLLDGRSSNPEINLHKKFVTAANIVDIFHEFKVPLEADYVSVDIDSCDLWLFSAITKKYRPRVMTVEYNSNYPMGNYTTLRCTNPMAKGAYHWSRDNIYGASLSAIELAAQKRGYSLVYVTPTLDAFLVRNDLLCEGTAVPKERFAAATGKKMWRDYNGTFGPKSELLVNFKEWLAAHSSDY